MCILSLIVMVEITDITKLLISFASYVKSTLYVHYT